MAAARILTVTPAALLTAGVLILASCGDPPPKPAPKPADTKPAAPSPSKPEDAKPAEAKPGDPMTTPANPTLPIEKITIKGKEFKLELANKDETRFHGLSGRTNIPEDGGMLFVFTARQVGRHGFVMRDCPVPIDIIYLDPSGRVVGTFKMVPEPPRSEAEKVLTVPPGYPAWSGTNDAYENRLKKYTATYPAQFVIELKGNVLDSLKLKDGEKIELDLDRLKKAAQ